MASSASSTTYTNSKSSRFSTSLKAFKFSNKDKDSKPPIPPPKDIYYLKNNRSLASLPPDSLSLPNSPLSPHSQRSLRPSPDMSMNHSSVSLVSSAASARSFSPAEPVPPLPSQAQKKPKGAGFFKFARRSPRAPSVKSPPPPDAPPPAPTEDENISMPFNFQHNIHVDEGFTGLPPSWTTSLTQAGFTEEEIADIQSRRRTGSRSPGSQYMFTDRPESPAYSSNQHSVLTNPTPRTSSLPRQFSDVSLGGGLDIGLRSPSSLNHPLYGTVSNTRSPPSQFSGEHGLTHHPSSSIHSLANSISTSVDSHVTSTSVSSFIQDAVIRPLGPTSPPALTDRILPSTPPRRVYHITNEAPLNSPPPSYANSNSPSQENGNSYSLDKKAPSSLDHASSLTSTPRSRSTTTSSTSTTETTPQTQKYQRPRASTDTSHERTPSNASTSLPGDSPPQSFSRSRVDSSKRLTALPPRLSLHTSKDSTDLTTWGEALLSGISTASDLTPNSSTFAVAQEFKLNEGTIPAANGNNLGLTNSAYYLAEAVAEKRSPPMSEAGTRARRPAPTRPIPPLNVRGISSGKPQPRSAFDSDEEEDALRSSFVEPATTARYDPAATSWDDDEPVPSISSATTTIRSDTVSPLWDELATLVSNEKSAESYDAALSETSSPTIPLSPRNGRDIMSVIKGRPPRMDEGLLRADEDDRERSNRDSSRSSTSTVIAFTEPATIVRNVSIARRTGAYVVDRSRLARDGDQERRELSAARQSPPNSGYTVGDARHPPSPLSSNFGSEEGSASGSGSSSSIQEYQTPTTEPGLDSSLMYYLDSTSTPDPSKVSFSPMSPHTMLVSATDTYGGVKEYEVYNDKLPEEDEDDDSAEMGPATSPPAHRPRIIISGEPGSASPTLPISSSGLSPLSPFQRYRGWLSEVVAPLEEFIDEAVDPRDFYLDLQEIAEGDSGSVFAARLTDQNIHKLKLPPLIKAHDADDLANNRTTVVAIKSVAILPSGSPKLIDLQHELTLMRGLWHENVLSMDAVYVDLVEDTLWIRMELMERSLADIIGLVSQGLVLQDRTIARFASDVLHAMIYLQKQRIVHRDVRSDNLLINNQGVLKLTDFSNAVQVARDSSMLSDPVGVAYWQAPEIRAPPYDALKIDVWSLGATVWELAEAEPPFAETQQFADRWPPLTKPQLYSPAYHEFLRICSEPYSTRPTPSELVKNPFINNACGRPVIIQIISQCMAIEQVLLEGDTSRGTISE